MKALFALAFSTQYRANVVLDGIASSIETGTCDPSKFRRFSIPPPEYKKSAEKLGDIEDLDPTPWRTELLRDWYWDFLMDITLDLPMVSHIVFLLLGFLADVFQAIYALILPAYLSPSSIASMALLQQATKSISLSIGQYTEDTPSFLGVCSQAKRLYNAINHKSTMPQGTEPFPRSIDKSYDAGMKISFR